MGEPKTTRGHDTSPNYSKKCTFTEHILLNEQAKRKCGGLVVKKCTRNISIQFVTLCRIYKAAHIKYEKNRRFLQ